MSKVNPTRKQSISQNNVANLLIGIAAGGAVGAAVALLFAPKSGNKLRKDLFNAYEDISEKAQDFVEDATKKGQKAASIAADYAEDFKDSASHFISDSEEITHSKLALLIGAIGGGILGASAIFLMAPKPTSDLRNVCHSAAQKFKTFDWMHTAKQVIANLNNTLNPEQAEEVMEEIGVRGKGAFNDALELASLGLRLWDNIKRG